MLDTTKRDTFLDGLIGTPWILNAKGPDAFDCYHMVIYVQRYLYGRNIPEIIAPANASYKWLATTFAHYQQTPEFQSWMVVDRKDAREGAIVLMGSTLRPSHIGVWFPKQLSILHCDKPDGVMFQDLNTLKMQGWHRLTFYDESWPS